jgi:hypothetical protein
VELRGEDDVVTAAAGERLANDLLRFALAVHVRGVDEVHPGVQGAMDDPDRVLVVRIPPRPVHHGAEAELADRHARAAEVAMLHQSLLFEGRVVSPDALSPK